MVSPTLPQCHCLCNYRVAQKTGNGSSHSHSDFKKYFIWNLILYFKWTKMSMPFYISIHKDLKSHIMKKHKGTKLTLQSWFHIGKGQNWVFHFTFKIIKGLKTCIMKKHEVTKIALQIWFQKHMQKQHLYATKFLTNDAIRKSFSNW